MSIIHPALLAGLAFITIPIILHFMLRSKPKTYLFPALQFIRERRTQNIQRMRIRHFWLLLLRILVIGLLVFVVARPSLPAANYEFNFLEMGTVVAILAACFGAYFYWTHRWKKASLPKHVLKYKNSWLKTIVAGGGVVLFLLLVALPYQQRIQAEITSPSPVALENVPVAAVMIFDTSVSMEYLQEGTSRIEQAKQIAADHLKNIPQGSKIAMTDTNSVTAIPWQADLTAALHRVKRTESLTISPLAYDLNQRMLAAIELQRQHRQTTLNEEGGSTSSKSETEDTQTDRFIREIYLFTDLTSSAWRMSGAQSLQRQLAAVPWLNVYLIDVGAKEPRNFAVADLRLSAQKVTQGRPLFLEATVRANGEPTGPIQVELYLETSTGTMLKRGEEQLNLVADQAVPVTFTLTKFPQDITRGEIRLLSNDPVRSDNRRYFTVAVKKPQKILLVSDRLQDAFAFSQALAPAALVRAKRAPYQVKTIKTSQLNSVTLSDYKAICLINVKSLNPPVWTNFSRYVTAGGGLAIVLGNTSIDTLNYQTVQETLLPAVPSVYSRFHPPEFIDFSSGSHPLVRSLDDVGAASILSTLNVNRYWKLEKEIKGTVLSRYSNSGQSPALLQRRIGDGNVMMLTTAVDLRGGAYNKNWSDLVRGGWAYMALADQMMQSLTGSRKQSYNITIGNELQFEMTPQFDSAQYWLQLPGIGQENITVPYRGPFLTLLTKQDAKLFNGKAGIKKVGHYSLIPDQKDAKTELGFSVNLDSRECDLTRLFSAQLDELLGEQRYQIVRNIEELEKSVNEGRLGRDVTPLVLLMMLFVFCGEHFVANNFYKNDD